MADTCTGAEITNTGNPNKVTDVTGYNQAKAQAIYACRYFEAVKENARINAVIAGIQQVASFYLADKQHEVAKQAQDRLDDTWADQKDKANKLFSHWYDNSRPIEIRMLNEASAREIAGYTVDYETAKNRVTATVRKEFSMQRQRLEREADINCTGATRVALRQLANAEARAIASAVNGAWRAEEARKDLKEAGYREEVYKWNGMFRGTVGESLNASRGASAAAAAASKIDPYAGWASSVGLLSNFGNALGNLNAANNNGAQQFYSSYGYGNNSGMNTPQVNAYNTLSVPTFSDGSRLPVAGEDAWMRDSVN